MATVQLRDIVSVEDRAAVMKLRWGPGQERFLGAMQSPFEDAEAEPVGAHGEQLVGFVMISDNIEESAMS